ncbi:MAG: T9SS type A sorting domain-containing protein [Bacteroidota bacterium]
MRRSYTLSVFLIMLMGIPSLFAQERYQEPVFSRADINVTLDVEYGQNVSILPVILGQSDDPIAVPLLMDIYEPNAEVDTLENRPLILFAVTGTFFPAYANAGFTGERNDSAVVEIAKRFTEMGYVVAVTQYRRGWNPTSTEIEAQRTILQAAYRGIQDLRNAVRFFRWSVEENENLYGVDIDKIAVGGTGTGAYVSYGATYLSSIEEVLLQKFIDFDVDPPAPFVDTLILGDVNGVNPALLNVPNYPEYSSAFNVGFGMDGALGDTSFISEGEPPYIAVHSAFNPGAPYDIGDVIATNASTGLPFAVIPTASGGLGTLRKANAMGLQDIFKDVEWTDPFSPIAASRNGGVLGLMPLITPSEQVGQDAMCLGIGVPGDTLLHYDQPWAWFDKIIGAGAWNFAFADQIADGTQITGDQAVCRSSRGIPNDPVVGRAYIDTVIGFIAPRLSLALGLDSGDTTTTSNRVYIEDTNVEVFPNPAEERFTIAYRTNAKRIGAVQVMDFTGRVIRSIDDLNTRSVEIQRKGLASGIYLLRIQVGEDFVSRRIQFD